MRGDLYLLCGFGCEQQAVGELVEGVHEGNHLVPTEHPFAGRLTGTARRPSRVRVLGLERIEFLERSQQNLDGAAYPENLQLAPKSALLARYTIHNTGDIVKPNKHQG